MKIFVFDYDSYGESFAVMANTKEEALDYLKTDFKNRTDSNCYEHWVNVTVDTLPKGYDIEEYLEGEIYDTEKA